MLYKSEKEEKEIIIRDLQEAKQMQKRLFPEKSPKIKNFNITGMCEPCLEVGGDWYDYIELPSGKIGVVLGDVAGKGLGAAFLMSSARMIMRMIATQEESPAKVLQKVNNILAADMPAAKFITLVYVVVDPDTRSFTIANAGHPDPVLSSNSGSEFLVTERGLPLGIKDYPFKENKIKMSKSDRLFLYSDGVSEAMNSKREMFENKRILESLGKPDADYKTLYNDVKNFIGKNPPNDDLTIVMLDAV